MSSRGAARKRGKKEKGIGSNPGSYSTVFQFASFSDGPMKNKRVVYLLEHCASATQNLMQSVERYQEEEKDMRPIQKGVFFPTFFQEETQKGKLRQHGNKNKVSLD